MILREEMLPRVLGATNFIFFFLNRKNKIMKCIHSWKKNMGRYFIFLIG